MNIVIFGAPGSGKGTQSSLLVEKKSMKHISTGDLFRNALKKQTELGKKAKAYIDDGKLVPDDITIGMVEEVFQDIGEKEFILDGFPRNTLQADSLEKLLEKFDKNIGKALFLDVPEQLLMERLTGRRICKSCGEVYHVKSKPPREDGVCLSCGGNEIYQRPDDQEAVISKRLEEYNKNTAPLIEYYRDKGKYVELNGVGKTEDVFERLLDAIEE